LFFERPLVLGRLNRAEIADAGSGIGHLGGLLLLHLELLQMFLLHLERITRGGQMLGRLLAFRLQLVHILLEGGHLGSKRRVLRLQKTDQGSLLAGVGILQGVQIRLHLLQLQLRVMRIRQRGVAGVVGPEQHDFRDNQHHHAHPREPVF